MRRRVLNCKSFLLEGITPKGEVGERHMSDYSGCNVPVSDKLIRGEVQAVSRK